MKIEIKHRITGGVIARGEAHSLKAFLEDNRGADLTDADFRGADFEGADLTGVNLTGVNLRGVDLTGATIKITQTKSLLQSIGVIVEE